MLRHIKTLTAAMLCVAMALCVSCKKNETEPSSGGGTTQIVATVMTNDVTEINKTTAVCGGEVVNENGWAVTERGVCWGTAEHPTLSDSYTGDGDGVGKFTSTLTGLEPGTTYYVRAYAKNAAGTGFGSEKSFTTLASGGGGGSIGGHEYVDLGLPSSLLWATCNVGADSPEDYGDYFAWGETEPKSYYDWDTYKWCNGDWNQLTKYCTHSYYGYNGFVDNKTVLEVSDDAVRANWGGDWRMPTKDELEELENNCAWTWTTQNGKDGCCVTGSNGNSIFLPAAGCYLCSSLYGAGFYGHYWLSSLDGPINACHFGFCSSDVYVDSGHRNYGQSVRPVCPSQK